MNQLYAFIKSKVIYFFIIQSFFSGAVLYAQQTTMKDYVLFGGSSTYTTGYVQLGSSTNVQGGALGSYKLIKSTGNSTVNANIYSGGTVQLANSNVISGKITAANSPAVSGTIMSVGSSANLSGNIDVNGNIVVTSGTVSGRVTHPTGTTYTGPVPGGGNITGTPLLPTLPQMPAITAFPPFPILPDINSTTSISPGYYDDIKLSGNKTLTFNGTGIYVFDLITNTGGTNNFVFNFQNDPAGTIKIYVHNQADLGKINASMINGGSATRIFTEVHGTGTCFNIANGSSSSAATKWLGTVWAPNGAINVGSGTGNSSITGALWSATQVNIQSGVNIVYAPYYECTAPNINAGTDKSLNFLNQTTLTATSITSGVSFGWQALNGGVITSPINTATITVSAAGTYVVTATLNAGCTATDTVKVNGKLNNLIGSELESVFENYTPNGPVSPFFVIQQDSIMIDVITKENQYAATLALLTTPAYGLTTLQSNGTSNFIITGLFPISKLPSLNLLTTYIVYVRPYYGALSKSGIVTSAGDVSLRSDLVRDGYKLQGEGIKVGVISNSFNTILSATTNPITNTAAQDIGNGDLPGPGNPNGYLTPVHVVKDYPFKSSDEGRGMLQIVHDIAPKAELYFRTGFISAGDFAKGITDLRDSGCNVIVDDITFITEPFLKDGIVANAVDNVAASGTTYFSAAGNFANKSYENAFNAVPAPGGIAASAHNFGGNDVFQSITLQPGNYTIVLQWLDDIYSLGQTAQGGTKNDLDIYLTPNTDGTALFGFNRNNTNGDPIEILPFTLTSTVTTNILIINNTVGSNPARFKYIVFKGDITFNEYSTGNSTLVGQANALGAIAVGAVRYDKAPPFVGPLSIESFSSIGGTVVNSVARNKPDIVAPDGVNTTVNLGPDYPSSSPDGYSNFFGTSAAAPHAAAVAALIMEGKKKFSNQLQTSPSEIRSILQSTATDMNTPGFDFSSGYGFLNADSAMRTFAKPDPTLIQLVVPASIISLGLTQFTLTVTGKNLSLSSVIKFRDSALVTTYINSETLTAVVPAFIGNPAISVYTPPISSSGLDGGSSDTLKFFSIVKKNITVTADNKVKKYGQELPLLTAKVLVDGIALENTSLTLAGLGLQNMNISTLAATNSNVGTYNVAVSRIFDHSNPDDVGLLELYNYTFNPGTVTIEKLPLTVIAENVTVTYGEKIPDIQFEYQFDGTNISNPIAFLNNIQSSHQDQIAKDALGNDILGLVNGQAVTIVNGQAIPIVNGQAVTIVNGQAVTIVNGQAIPIVNGQAITIVNGQAIPIVNNLTAAQVDKLSFLTTTPVLQNSREITNKTLVNGVYQTSSTEVVDVTQESILDYDVNSAQTYMLSSVSQTSAKGMIDINSFANGQAVTIVNGQAVTIVNGQAVTIVNGQAVTIVNGQAVTIVNGQAIPIVNSEGKTAVVVNETEIGQGQSQLKSLNMITGIDVGNQFIIPGSFVNDNFDITHIAGTVTIVPAPVTITATAGQTKVYGNNDPVFTYSNNAGLIASDFTGSLGRVSGNNVGQYDFTLGNLSAGSNYSLILNTANKFAITKRGITVMANAGQNKVYGNADPVFTFISSEPLQTGNSYSGALGRVPGETVAGSPYAFTIGSLSAGNNYTLTLTGTNTFAITKKQVTITPTVGQSKVYGDNDPVFSYSNDGGLTAANFTGVLGRVSGSNVGNYAYTTGTLSAGSNYNLVLSAANTFAITKAPLNVKANDTYIYKGDAIPVFTSTFTTLKAGDNPTVTYTLSPVCTGDPGVYTITALLNPFANSVNYTITYTAGKFYINPKGNGAKKLRPYLDCVEEVMNPASPSRRYIAHFYCINDNSTPLYVPIGNDNKVSSTGGGSFDASQQPAVFTPGFTWCHIPFDGTALKWEVTTYESTHKSSVSSNASSGSNKCNYISTGKSTYPEIPQSLNTSKDKPAKTEMSIRPGLTVYPNPATDKVRITLSDEVINEKTLVIVDSYGRTYKVKITGKISEHSLEIDLSHLITGMYFIKVNLKNGYRILPVFKK